MLAKHLATCNRTTDIKWQLERTESLYCTCIPTKSHVSYRKSEIVWVAAKNILKENILRITVTAEKCCRYGVIFIVKAKTKLIRLS